MTMEQPADLRRSFRLTVIANAAIIASLFILWVVVEIIKSGLNSFRGFSLMPHGQLMRYVFYSLAIIVVILVRVLGRVLVRPRPGESHQALIQKLSRAAICTSSLAEIPALLGFVLFLLLGVSRDFYVLLFVSLVLEFMYFPRIRTWEEIMRGTIPQPQK
jgi:hypothetical protein